MTISLVVCCDSLNEDSGEGSSEAGPVAKKILESYFERRGNQ